MHCVRRQAILLMRRKAFFGADRLASASINLGCVSSCMLGRALITPVLSDVLVRLLEFRRTAFVLAAICSCRC